MRGPAGVCLSKKLGRSDDDLSECLFQRVRTLRSDGLARQIGARIHFEERFFLRFGLALCEDNLFKLEIPTR